jgi:hypothetical protein
VSDCGIVIYTLQNFEQRICFFIKKVNQPVELAGLGESLAVNAYRTLKVMRICVTVVGNNRCDPLGELGHELRFIAGNNILEVLQVDMDVELQDDASYRAESKDWSAFDSVLAGSGAFPRLYNVSLEISWRSVSGRDVDLQVYTITEDTFPRLVASNAVVFDFSSQTY